MSSVFVGGHQNSLGVKDITPALHTNPIQVLGCVENACGLLSFFWCCCGFTKISRDVQICHGFLPPQTGSGMKAKVRAELKMLSSRFFQN